MGKFLEENRKYVINFQSLGIPIMRFHFKEIDKDTKLQVRVLKWLLWKQGHCTVSGFSPFRQIFYLVLLRSHLGVFLPISHCQ